MKKVVKKVALLLIVFGIGVGVTLLYMNNKYKVYEEEEPKQIKKHVDTISMMLETEAGSGNYEMTTRESWPAEGYKFNNELSKCENGGEVYWDNENKKVFMSSNSSDKCYIYFDIIPTIADFCSSGNNLSSCLITLANNGGSNKTNIYYHDTNLVNGAEDNSYRYAGASENVNNFVCFGTNTTPCPTDNLYRIIGVFGDQVKLIKYDYANSNLLGTDGASDRDRSPYAPYYKGSLTTIRLYYWNSSTQDNTWSKSNLNKVNLNTNFINNIRSEWAAKIAETTWKVGGNTYDNIQEQPAKIAYQNEIKNPAADTKCEAKIGLMYVSDYMYAASPTYWTYVGYNYSDSTKDYRAATTSNWMYMGHEEWTITPDSSESDYVFIARLTGQLYSYSLAADRNAVRPVLYLKASVAYAGGSGTKDSPITLAD